MPFVLGVDSSAHATTVELRDAQTGELFGEGRSVHPDDPDEGERDPHVWWNALVDARRDAGGALGVNAVAVAAQMQGLVVLDGEANVIRPAKLHGDAEVGRYAESLVEAFGGPQQWVEACGVVPDSTSSVAKLAWLRGQAPDDFARIAKVMSPHDYLTFRLSRKVVTDRGDASTSGFFSSRDDEWRTDALALVDPDKSWAPCLPRVADAGTAAGDREGVTIAAGTGATMAAAVGLDVQPRDVVISFDQSMVFRLRDRPTEDPSGRVAGWADATGRFLPVVRSTVGPAVLDAMANVLGVDRTRFERLALEAPPGAQGVSWLPPVPARRGRAREPGTLIGFDASTTPALMARAVVEGVAHGLLDDVDALRHADVPVGGRLFVLGANRSHALAQVLADLSRRAVKVPKGARVAVGASAIAAASLLDASPTEVAGSWKLDRAREVEPNPNVDADHLRDTYRHAMATRAEGNGR
jgi:xylulokinase